MPVPAPWTTGRAEDAVRLHPDIRCTQIPVPAQGAPSLRGSLVVSCLVGLDMCPQSGVPDRSWIDLVIFGIEEIESDPIASERICTPQTNVHTERLPAIDDARTKDDTFNSTGRKEKLA